MQASSEVRNGYIKAWTAYCGVGENSLNLKEFSDRPSFTKEVFEQVSREFENQSREIEGGQLRLGSEEEERRVQ
jgi:hypothetical protein